MSAATPSVFGYHLNFDKDFIFKGLATVATAAATAAATAGLGALVQYLSSDPRYAIFATIITLVVSALSKKPAN